MQRLCWKIPHLISSFLFAWSPIAIRFLLILQKNPQQSYDVVQSGSGSGSVHSDDEGHIRGTHHSELKRMTYQSTIYGRANVIVVVVATCCECIPHSLSLTDTQEKDKWNHIESSDGWFIVPSRNLPSAFPSVSAICPTIDVMLMPRECGVHVNLSQTGRSAEWVGERRRRRREMI